MKRQRPLTKKAFLALVLAGVFTGSAAAEVVISENANYTTAPAWSEDVTINSDAAVTMANNVLVKQTGNITINIDGSLSFSGDKTDNHATTNSLVIESEKSIVFAGTGTLIKTGTGVLAIASGNYTSAGNAVSSGYSVKFAMESNALIDIQKGTLRNGGFGYQNWTDNKADMQIASGATFDLWDGAAITIDSLYGAGTISETASSKYDKNFTLGVDNSALTSGTDPVFSGPIKTDLTLVKKGTGTQILSGANTYTGATKIEAGTLQFGNGDASGTLGGGAVTVSNGATLAFKRSDTYVTANALTNNGTVDVLSGVVSLTGTQTIGSTAVYKVSSGTGLSILSQDMLAKTTYTDGSILLLRQDDSDSTAWTAAQILGYRTGTTSFSSNALAGVWVASGKSMTGDALMAGAAKLYTGGPGTVSLTAANTDFTGGIQITEGTVRLSGSASVNANCLITADKNGTLAYDYGANTTTVVSNLVSGTGTMLISSGLVKYTSASPKTAHTITYNTTSNDITVSNTKNVDSRVEIAQTTIQSGAELSFETNAFPCSVGTAAFTIESGGLLTLSDSSTSVNHGDNNSFSIYQGKLTVNGAGTLRKTGAGAVALLNNNYGAGSLTIAQSEGGWVDVQAGTLINGGWSSSIVWSNNKGSVNLATGTAFNLWDGNTITIDNLTGSGTFQAGGVKLGVANNANSTTYGVANNTAEFSGIIQDTAASGRSKVASVTKVGTGTQILSGNNTYSGTTTVSNGTLQIGNGGASGTIGAGAISVNGTGVLAFNTTTETTLAQKATGQGTVANMCSGSVLNLGTASTAADVASTVSLRSDAGATINYYLGSDANKTLSGTYSGAGTIHFAGENAKINARDSLFSMANTGKTVVDSGTFTAPASSEFGTLVANGNTVWNVANANSWTITMYTDTAVSGKITPSTPYASWSDLGTSQNADKHINATANYGVPSHTSAVSYTSTVYVPNDIKLDLSGSYDDWAGLFVKKLANADGSVPDNSDWTALLPYSESQCGRVTVSDVSLAAGTYLMDARVADNGGSAYANSAALKDPSGKRLGIGIRLTGGSLSGDIYYSLDITDAGLVALPNGEIVTYNAAPIITSDFEIADGATLTVLNESNKVTRFTINSDSAGAGTLALSNTSGSAIPYNYNGTVDGSLSIGGDILMSGSGSIAGDLILENGSIFDYDLDSTSQWTVGGDLVIKDGAEMTIHSDTANPEVYEFYDLVKLTGEESTIQNLSDLTISYDLPDGVLGITRIDPATGSFQAVLGTSASIPEPSTWVLLVLGAGCVAVFRRNRK